MITTNLLQNTGSHKVIGHKGCFSVIEFLRDISVSPAEAQTAFFASQMNIRKKQLVAELNDACGVVVQSGAMQLMLGAIDASTNIKSAGDLMKKFVSSKVTGETVIKPHYIGDGIVVLEPTYRYIILEDLADWGGNMVIEDGMFLACEDTVAMRVTARSTVSSVVLGHEGLFNTSLYGEGIVALESPSPAEELFVVDIVDDVLKIDGDMAIAWSSGLSFTVERTTKTLIGSAASGEGLVNVFRGSGRVLIAPIAYNRRISVPEGASVK